MPTLSDTCDLALGWDHDRRPEDATGDELSQRLRDLLSKSQMYPCEAPVGGGGGHGPGYPEEFGAVVELNGCFLSVVSKLGLPLRLS